MGKPKGKCHNPRCERVFELKRRDQIHCDEVCKERCKPCKRRYYPRMRERLKQLRKDKQLGRGA